MKFFKILTLILGLSLFVNNVFADESEVLFKAMGKVAEEVSLMEGLKNAKNISLLVVKPSEEGGKESVLIEDVIINELAKTGKYTLIETRSEYLGDLSQVITREAKLDEKVSNVGELLGADTLLIGSHYSPVVVKKKKHIPFFNIYETTAEVKLNIRTVDTETNKVTSSKTVSEKAVKKKRKFSVGVFDWMILSGVLALHIDENKKYDYRDYYYYEEREFHKYKVVRGAAIFLVVGYLGVFNY